MDRAEIDRIEARDERLREAARLILPIEFKLKSLSKDQIEELVIWLKSIHNPPNPEDRSTDVCMPFYNRVGELRNIPEQLKLQRDAAKACRYAISTGIIIGMLVMVAVVWGLVTGNWIIPVLLCMPVYFSYKNGLHFAGDAILISKDQEQRHLWRCIREAKGVPQLQSAGLYAHIKNEDFDKHTQQMRDAIYCNADDGQHFAEALEYLRGEPI
jgi:hypothetical protein